jgi:hypothetical protein
MCDARHSDSDMCAGRACASRGRFAGEQPGEGLPRATVPMTDQRAAMRRRLQRMLGPRPQPQSTDGQWPRHVREWRGTRRDLIADETTN